MNLLQMNVSAALIITVAVLIRAVALDRLPKPMFQLFWLVATLRLLIPFSFSSGLSIYNLFQKAPASAGAPAPAAPALPAGGGPVPGAAGPPVEATRPFPVLTAVWLCGILLTAAYFLLVNRRSKGRYACSLPLQHDGAGEWLRQNGPRRRVSLRVSDRIGTPLTYGLVRPVILLPKTLDVADTERLRYVLTHEMLHIKRFDLLKKMALSLTLCLHWFNPLVWVMVILANRDIELSCDAGVLRELGADKNEAYALTLLAMQEEKSGALLVNHFSKHAIQERICSIMKKSKISALAIATSLFLVVGTTVAFASSAVPMEDREENPQMETDKESGLLFSQILEDTGETRYSDDGETWLTADAWNAEHPTPDVEWWTAEEYAAWLDAERVALQEIIGSKGWNQIDGPFEWTEDKVDATIAMYEEILREIQNGVLYSKTVDGRDDISLNQDRNDAEPAETHGADITEGEETVSFENADRETAEFLEKQVAGGRMTPAEAQQVLQDLQDS